MFTSDQLIRRRSTVIFSIGKHLFFCTFFLFSILSANGQSYDMLIKGGHLIDPKNRIDGLMDIALKNGKVAQVASSIPPSSAKTVVDAKGLYISPGFIDIHSHNYFGTDPHTEYNNGYNALSPDAYTFPSGVTTTVDAGSSGWRNFVHFKEQVIDHMQTRVLAILNIVGYGMKGNPFEQNIDDMDPKLAALVAQQYKNYIVGIKLAHYNGHDWTPTERAVEAGKLANLPVMIDFGSATPTLSLETLCLEKLRPGDIYTHAFGGGGGGREAIVDASGTLRPFALTAQKRGIIFDVGHGGASFFWKNVIPAMKAGLKPNTISTDAHGRSALGGMKSMANVMSKFLNLGMPLQEVIAASTWAPANVIRHPELGHLSVGSEADLTVFTVRKGNFGFLERAGGTKMTGTQKIEVELTLRAGKVVWDLNGISGPLWQPDKTE